MLLQFFKRFKSIKKEIAELKAMRQPVVLNERDLVESFVKGSGPGGQAVNKRNNAVWLTHKPTGIQVKCHKTRSLELNRHEARKLLITELDNQINGSASLQSIESMKEREKARLKRRKADAKYGQDRNEKSEDEFAAKSMERNAKRCEKEEAAEKLKLKKAIEKQNFEGAKIYAESAIRKKNEALNYRRLAARIDGVASQVQTAVTMRTVSKSMNGVVNGLSQALEANQMEKVSMIMDQFEAQSENMAVQSSYMESAMRNTTALTTPEDQVTNLMQQVADEHGLDLKNQLGSLSPAASAMEAAKEADDPLTERLARLRNS